MNPFDPPVTPAGSAGSSQACSQGPSEPSDRFIGIDVGAETIKIVELTRLDGFDGSLRCVRRQLIEHGKEPGPRLLAALKDWQWPTVSGAAISGRMARQVDLPHVPTKQAQSRGFRFLRGNQPATLVSIGSHGFSVLELRGNGLEVFRENSRCSQGTGNFLRQLVERFSLGIAEASELCADVEKPAPLSGRCPVILKTDMTHLANKGESRAEILAGLFDAVCENVSVLVKAGVNPHDVFLIGGVSRSRRVQKTFATLMHKVGLELGSLADDDALFMEAIGAAIIAAEAGPTAVPVLAALLLPPAAERLERVAALRESLRLVQRLPSPPMPDRSAGPRELILGFDIGSTGSKLVALDPAVRAAVWEGYRRTAGDPVGAAQDLLKQFVAANAANAANESIRALGVTGSGREIVGSLMATCYGKDTVFILNEIAAHAEGALHFDSQVDTIFEIGGQDAKYIRLAGGRVIDAAMNEACSAGTGSFIEEQGRKFAGIQDVAHLGREAMCASCGVSLGQHCSVFMAEIIDEAVAGGVAQSEIIAGLYDSIIQNYLHRVKGNRSVGQVIFCQGLPFAADALAAAVARQTGSRVVIPPNPGTVGALGISLLAEHELPWRDSPALDAGRFLDARIEAKETFICKSNTGCGGAGNKCRIDSIRTVVAGQHQRFTWGGGCSLHDKGTRKKKLPDLAPDPFREREDLISELLTRISAAVAQEGSPRKVVAISDQFMLKGLFPFFATFLHELGFELKVPAGADHAALKRGVQESNVQFCAPMQLFHGLAGKMADDAGDYLFIPMLRSTPRGAGETRSVVCPIVQGTPDVLSWDLRAKFAGRLISPTINIGSGNLQSPEFLRSCQSVAEAFGVMARDRWDRAHRIAAATQGEFDLRCRELGRQALAFCAEKGIVPVVVLGRPYTIYNKVLNSNVPALLREQGAIGIPIDCFPLPDDVPIFDDIYWGYSQRILRAAHQVRRLPGVYSLFCSNYACGPDSFGLHFYSHIMEGKPFAIIETDGHAGDAGTKTRVEAFLHCVEQDRRAGGTDRVPNDFQEAQVADMSLARLDKNEHLLIPTLGASSGVVAAALRGRGFKAETLANPGPTSLRLGRRHTSGKECSPMYLTLGTLLERLEREKDTGEKFVMIMPRTCGPCRFGVYGALTKITLDRLGWGERVRLWSPRETSYFSDLPAGFSILVFAGLMACDLLLDALFEVRPAETRPGATNEIYERHYQRLLAHVERMAFNDLSAVNALWQVAGGHIYGIPALLAEAAAEFATVRGVAAKPTVLVVGEIYVRSVPFANDSVIAKLEERGCRVRLAPINEMFEYTDYINIHGDDGVPWSQRLTILVQSIIRRHTSAALEAGLGLKPRSPIEYSLVAAAPFVRSELLGETVQTIGAAVHEWQAGEIDAVLSAGPLECMPNKVAEAQFFHVAEKHGLPSLTLSFNGDPLNTNQLDNFVFEVQTRFQRKNSASVSSPGTPAELAGCA